MRGADILKKVAPLLGTAIAGPFGGLAVEAIGAAFGWTDTTKAKVEAALTSGQLSGEQIMQLKTAEQNLRAKLRELDIKEEELAAADRKSARELLIATRARTPAILSWVVVIGNFALMGYLLVCGTPEGLDPILLGRILGTLDTSFGLVLAFWLGTSHGSRSKDDTISLQAASGAR